MNLETVIGVLASVAICVECLSILNQMTITTNHLIRVSVLAVMAASVYGWAEPVFEGKLLTWEQSLFRVSLAMFLLLDRRGVGLIDWLNRHSVRTSKLDSRL